MLPVTGSVFKASVVGVQGRGNVIRLFEQCIVYLGLGWYVNVSETWKCSRVQWCFDSVSKPQILHWMWNWFTIQVFQNKNYMALFCASSYVNHNFILISILEDDSCSLLPKSLSFYSTEIMAGHFFVGFCLTVLGTHHTYTFLILPVLLHMRLFLTIKLPQA